MLIFKDYRGGSWNWPVWWGYCDDFTILVYSIERLNSWNWPVWWGYCDYPSFKLNRGRVFLKLTRLMRVLRLYGILTLTIIKIFINLETDPFDEGIATPSSPCIPLYTLLETDPFDEGIATDALPFAWTTSRTIPLKLTRLMRVLRQRIQWFFYILKSFWLETDPFDEGIATLQYF